MEFRDKKNRYSIRKLAVGVASVLVGTSMLTFGSNEVKADAEQTSSVQTAQESTPEASTGQDVQDRSTTEDTSKENKVIEESDMDLALSPVQAVKDEKPDAKSAIPNWSDYANYISNQDSDAFNVSWKNAPDTSKVGKTYGIIEIKGKGFDINAGPTGPEEPSLSPEESDPSDEIDKLVKIPVIVYNSKDDYLINYNKVTDDSDDSGDLIHNTIKFYDVENKEIIQTDQIAGTRDSYADPNKWGFDDNVLKLLGYERVVLDGRYQYAPQNYDQLSQFGDSDQTYTVFIKPIHPSEENHDEAVNGIIVRRQDNIDAYTSIDFINDVDPAWFIGNLPDLPANAEIKWGVKPKFDEAVDRDGNYLNPCVKNNPTIVITYTDKNGENKIITLGGSESSDLSKIILREDTDYTTVKGDIQVVVGQSLNAKDAISEFGNGISDDQHNNVMWSVKPDTTHPGYTVGKIFNPAAQQSYYVLIKVLPKKQDTDDPIVQEEKTPVKPTAPIIDLPTAQPKQNTIFVKIAKKVDKSSTKPSIVRQNNTSPQKITKNVAAPVKTELPETGERNQKVLVILGLGLAGLALGAMLSFRKKN